MSSFPALVHLVPGMHGSFALFERVRAAIERRGIDVEVRAWPDEVPLGYDDLEPLLLDALDPVRTNVLVAESFGGPLAIRVAASAPARVGGLVLAATFLRNPLPIGLRWIARLAHERVMTAGADPMPDRAMRWLAVDPADDPELAEVLRASILAVDPAVAARRAREVARVDVRAAFASLDCPIAVIEGRLDPLVGPRSTRRMSAIRPDLEIHRLETRHLVLQTEAEASAAVIASIVQRATAGVRSAADPARCAR